MSPPPLDLQAYKLRLFIAGMTPAAARALETLRRLCQEHLPDRHVIEVVDLLTDPACASVEQIFAVPTVVRDHPAPKRKVIGDLTDTARVLSGLDIGPRK